jgi:16S rRNA (guanine527-N7)-methyltransferase
MIRADLEIALREIGQSLSDDNLQSFEVFASELKKWNRKVNLTAINNDTDIAVKHLIDAIFFVSSITSEGCVMDIGSGAGIPGIPLKIIKPVVRVISVDAVGKKIMFQKHVSRLLGLNGFDALHTRAESLHVSHAGLCDVITSRAFSRLDLFATLAAPMLRSDGKLIAMKGPDVHAEILGVESTLRKLGFEISSVSEYSLPMQRGKRSLVTMVPVNAHK